MDLYRAPQWTPGLGSQQFGLRDSAGQQDPQPVLELRAPSLPNIFRSGPLLSPNIKQMLKICLTGLLIFQNNKAHHESVYIHPKPSLCPSYPR